MIVHGLENVSIPSVWQDWDMDKGGIEDHKRRRTRVLLEMIAIMVVRSVFHALMVLPVIITGNGKLYQLCNSGFFHQLKMFGKDMNFLVKQLGFYQKKKNPTTT